MVKREKVVEAMLDYVASFSGGKDSTAMVLRLIEEDWPLDAVVFYDTGAEFPAVLTVADAIREECEKANVRFIVLRPKRPFFLEMMAAPVNFGKPGEHYGYEWCGGCTRWGTTQKILAIDKLCINAQVQYVGIAADEAHRAKDKRYPLIEWGMTEADCLKYCRDKGISWEQDGIDLYDILDRVSCWCCSNKNIKELRNIYHHLPYWWSCLKGLQSRIDRPFKAGKTIYDYEERFLTEDAQMRLPV